MRLPFFPIAEEGESFYSVVARFLQRTAGPSTRKLDFLNLRSAARSALVPRDLDALTKAMPMGHPWCDAPRVVLLGHTTVPMHLYFAPPTRAAKVFEMLASGTIHQPISALGITSERLMNASSNGRFCPDCVLEDTVRRGFTVGHREHETYLVTVCARHRTALRYGCLNCFRGRKAAGTWQMAGTCECGEPMHPADIDVGRNPVMDAGMIWLAQQVSLMLSDKVLPKKNRVQILRQALIDRGFAYHQGIRGDAIVEALMARFGKELLVWAQLCKSSKHEPSTSWPGRMLTNEHRVPTVVRALLLTALVADDVNQLSNMDGPSTSRSVTVPRGYSSGGTAVAAGLEAIDIRCALDASDQKLTVAATVLGVSSYPLVTRMKQLGMRHPLTAAVKRRLGQAKLIEVQLALREGVPKKKILLTSGISEWTLMLIEVDDLALSAAHRDATIDIQRSKHRTALVEYLRVHSSATRTEVMEFCSGSFDWLRTFDKVWLLGKLPARKRAESTPRKPVVDWQKKDKMYEWGIRDLAKGELTRGTRPVRLTKSSFFKKLRVISGVSRNCFPLTLKAATECAESMEEFQRRRLAWALKEYQKLAVPVSVNLLRRMAGLTPAVLKTHRAFIIEQAEELRIAIDARSFLSPFWEG